MKKKTTLNKSINGKTLFKLIKSLGKRKNTIQFGNNFWIKEFEFGYLLRKRSQGEILLDSREICELAWITKDSAGLFSENQLNLIWYKFPETKGFIERIKHHDLTYEEMEELKRQAYELIRTKNKMLGNLEE